MLALMFAAALSGGVAADEAAVREIENRWSAAYVTGDAAFLSTMLTDDYVSVGENGGDHPKAAIVASALAYAKSHPGAAATPMPATSTVTVTGDIAVVRHHDPEHVSVDVFQKQDGVWRALYSQHTHVTKAG